MSEPICPLCRSAIMRGAELKVHKRRYHHCEVCALIFMDKSDLPDMVREKERYLQHHNHINNEGYVHFLMTALDPILPTILVDMDILDYGCGPDPVLSDIIISIGFHCDLYDPFFYPVLPAKKYNFIFATECFEHFFEPKAEILKISNLLSENGTLVVMTELWKDPEYFQSWYYVRDFTHVSFYHPKTMNFIEQNYGMKIIYTDHKRLVVFRKP
jgi:Methyltransferase domain